MTDFQLMLQFLKEASNGASILIIGKNVWTGSYRIGQGSIFVRDNRPVALKSVAVDTVVFLDEPTPEVLALAMERVRGQKSYRIFEPWKENNDHQPDRP